MTETEKPNLTGKLWCYYIDQSQARREGGFIPSIVIAGEPGHWPMTGRDELGVPWYWGTTQAEAQAVCEAENSKRGITPRLASMIVGASMFPTDRLVTAAWDLAHSEGYVP